MDVYSITLLLGSIGAGGAALLAVLDRLQRFSHPLVRILTLSAVAFSCLNVGISLYVHARFGHGPASLEPMGFARFFAHHPAYPIVTGSALAAMFSACCKRARA